MAKPWLPVDGRLLTAPPITLWSWSVNGIDGASGAFEKAIHQSWTGSDTIRVSQIRHGKSTLSRPFSVTNLGSPDRVWSCPDFPNSSRKIHPQQAIFRDEFGKPWSCLILSSPDRVWSWSECNNSWRRRRRRRTKHISMVLDTIKNAKTFPMQIPKLSYVALIFFQKKS